MISTSFAFRRRIAENTKTLVKATLTLADETVRELDGTDIMMGTTSFDDSVSSANSFDIGTAIINRFTVTLNNYDGRFDDYDFTGSTIEPYEGVRLDEDTVEWIKKGIFNVEQPESYSSTIGLNSLDNMSKFEVPYSEVDTVYPATLYTIVNDMCLHCGVTLLTTTFANSSYVVEERPDDSSLTCLAMLAYVGQVSCNWVRCDNFGRLTLKWFNTDAYEDEDWLNGDRFDDASPYASGDTADGGDFTFTTGASEDGGGFAGRTWIHVYSITGLTVSTDDVVITGVRVTAQDGAEDDEVGETYLYGAEGYVLDIPNNPLIQYGEAEDVATQIGLRCVGMRFRPFSVSALGDPSIEAGDPVIITDAKQRQYRSFITSLTHKVGDYEALSCGAKTPSRNSASSYSALTQAIVKLRNADKAEITARELAVQNLEYMLSTSSGLYKTEVEQADHSVIYYMHDKRTLAESQIVWKMTANALGISSDGGQTYPYGLDVSGNAILNRIYAIGLDASYITSGCLTIRDGQTTVFSANATTGAVAFQDVSGNHWNLHTGEVAMAASASLGGRTVQSILSAVDATITDTHLEYAQNQDRFNPPAESSSDWSETHPTWQSGWYIWQRMATTTASGTSYSDPVCISGRDGSSGTNAALIYLYARGSSAPSTLPGTLTYTFSDASLVGDLNGWSRGIPSGDATCWTIAATAVSNSTTDTIAPSEWSSPVQLGTAGIDGLNQATIYLHKRLETWHISGDTLEAPTVASASLSGTVLTVAGTVSSGTLSIAADKPTAPSATLTYTFATGALTGSLGGWSRDIPDGDAPCWVTTAVAISNSTTDSIAPSEWSEVVKLVENGRGFTIEAVDYAIGSDSATPPEGGWQKTVPTVVAGAWLWTRTTYNDGTQQFVCSYEGIDIEGDVNQYYLSTSETELVGGAWSIAQPEWQDGTYIWTRKAITYSNGTTVYTEPILARLITQANAVAYKASEDIITLDQALDMEGVFNRLTNNGTVQGLYMENEQVYINASYIMTGILNASLVQTGALIVRRNDVTVFSANFETGAVEINSDCITVGSSSLTSTVKAMQATYGTCATAATTRAKVVTCNDFELRIGATVNVKFTNGNSIASPQLNVNGTGSKTIKLNGADLPEDAYWKADETVSFTYDGTYWVMTQGFAISEILTNKQNIAALQISAEGFSSTIESHTQTFSQLKATYGTCSTAAATATKAVTCSNFALYVGATVHVSFANANTASNPQLNVNGTGSKAIRLNGASLTSDAYWKAGETVSFVYDGTYWNITDGAATARIISDASRIATLEATSEQYARSFTAISSEFDNIDGSITTINSNYSALVQRADGIESTVKGVQATYGTCTTAGGTQVKVSTIANFQKFVGQTVTIKFTYKNTAEAPELKVQNSDGSVTAQGPIYMNNSALSESQYWGAQDVMTFVWDGTYWRVSDGYVTSSIKQLADSISLSITNGSLGNTASIVLSAGGNTTTKTLNLTGVRNAFKNDTTAIAITGGTVTFDSNTFVVNSTYFSVTNTGIITATGGTIGGFTLGSTEIYNTRVRLNQSGVHIRGEYNDVLYDIGHIGINNIQGYPLEVGVVFDLDYYGSYMTWASKDSLSSSTYTMRLTYANRDLTTSSGTLYEGLHIQCNIDGHNYTAHRFWIDPSTYGGGAVGGRSGNITLYGKDSGGNTVSYTLTFKNGFLIGW